MGGFGGKNDTYGKSGYIDFHVAVINIFRLFFSTDAGMPKYGTLG